MKPLDPRLVRRSTAVRRQLKVAVALGVAQAVLVIVTSWFVARVVAERFTGQQFAAGSLALAAGVALAFLGRAVAAWALAIVSDRASADVKRELRDEVLSDITNPRRLGPLPESSRLVTLMGSGMDAFDGYAGRFLPQLALSLVVPPIVIVVIAFHDWVSALIVVLTLPLTGIFMALVGMLTQDKVQRRWAAMERLGRHFADVLDGLVVLKVFRRDQSAGLRAIGDRHRRESLAALKIAFLSTLVLELVSTISVALVAVGVGLRVVNDHLDLEPAMLVLLLAPEAFLPVRRVGTLFHDSQEGAIAAGELLDLCEHPVHAGTHVVPADVSLTFQGVEVRHDDRIRASLTLEDEEIAEGEFVVITGPSGSGKSTLLSLALGIIAPDAGRVLVGGVDLATLDVVAWRERIAWVPQSPGILGGTIASNVTLGLDQVPMAAVVQALADVGARDLAPARVVAESGADLSAGEKRRVAVARALVRVRCAGARIVMLDEPTAGLDYERESEVLEALRSLDATVIVVSHRADTIASAGRVIHVRGPEAETDVDPTPALRPGAPTPSSPVSPAATQARPARGGVTMRLPGGIALGAAAQLAAIGLLLVSAWLIVRAAEHPPVLYLMVAIVSVRFFGISRAVLRYCERLVTHDAAFRQSVDTRVEVYRNLDRVAPVGLTGRRRGDVISRVVSDVEALQDLTLRVRVPWAVGAVSVVAVLVLVGWLDLASALVLACAVVLVVVGLRSIVTRRQSERLARRATAQGALSAEVSELVLAAPDLVVHGAAAAALASARSALDQLHEVQQRGSRIAGAGSALAMMAMGGAVALIALLTGDVDRVLVGVLVLAPIALIESLDAWAEAVRLTPATRAAAARLAELATIAPAIEEPSAPAALPSDSTLEAHSLVVGWDSDLSAPLDLTLVPGSVTALTGPSGSGKSTLALTLARLIEPRAGHVVLGGVNTDQLRSADVRSVVGYVGQDEAVFDTSIRENLRIARPDAAESELDDAVGRAGLANFVANLPRGLDTMVGEHGRHLSGGERQRLGIARLLLGGHRVLIFDEPTEQLDAPTSVALMDDILTLAPSHTLIVISHAPWVVRRCEAVVALG